MARRILSLAVSALVIVACAETPPAPSTSPAVTITPAPPSPSASASPSPSASASAPASASPPAAPDPIPCKTAEDCWFDDSFKPIARPAKQRGKKITPCKNGGEHAPACNDGACIVRAFKC